MNIHGYLRILAMRDVGILPICAESSVRLGSSRSHASHELGAMMVTCSTEGSLCVTP